MSKGGARTNKISHTHTKREVISPSQGHSLRKVAEYSQRLPEQSAVQGEKTLFGALKSSCVL